MEKEEKKMGDLLKAVFWIVVIVVVLEWVAANIVAVLLFFALFVLSVLAVALVAHVLDVSEGWVNFVGVFLGAMAGLFYFVFSLLEDGWRLDLIIDNLEWHIADWLGGAFVCAISGCLLGVIWATIVLGLRGTLEDNLWRWRK